METDKPPYRVPTMEEIAALPDNGLKVVSTFSGCGGSCLGYRMAGYRIAMACEFIPEAVKTYQANNPSTPVDTRDIRKVQPEEILEAIGLKRGELDLMEGSPPCASFSTAGKRERHWGQAKKYSDTVQRTDDLFFEFARLVQGVQPRVFVAENVSGLVKGVAKGYFLEILARLKACGYRVRCKVLDAQWLGVPQARQRAIFIGVRNDLAQDPVFPHPLPYRYSLREALPWVIKGKYGPAWKTADSPSPTVSAQQSYNPQTSHQGLELVEAVIHDTRGKFGSAGDVTDRPCPTITAGGAGQFNVKFKYPKGAPFDQKGKEIDMEKLCPTITTNSNIELGMERFAIGREWDKLRPGEASEKYFNLVRPDPEAPCPTICASHGHPGVASVTHPTEKRKLSIEELKRICAFPDDFILTGTYSQQWERLGRAVPPVFMFHVARTLRDEILAP